MCAPMLGVSGRAFAKLDRCTENRVRRGIARGELATLADGTLDPAIAGTAWRKQAEANGGDATEAPAGGTLAEADRQHQISLARLRRQEWLALRAQYVDAETAASVERASVRRVCRMLRKITAELVPLVTGKTRPEIARAVREVVHAALTEASSGKPSKPPAATTSDDIAITDGMARIEAERSKVIDQTRIHSLNFDIREGRSIALAPMAAAYGRRCSIVRMRLLQLEGVLPTRCFSKSEAAVRKIISESVAEALEALTFKR